MSKKLKVIFITQDEPFYIPTYINSILNELVKEEVDVLKVYALPPNLSNKSFLQTVQGFLSYFGIIVFSYMVFLRITYIISDFINQHIKLHSNLKSVKLVCRKFGIKYSKVVKINSDNVLSELTTLNPDIVFSVACPQIFSKKIISIPSIGCLNIHSSLLPKYRGLNANFWVLAKGEKMTGVTIHYIKPGIDNGDILLQEKIIIDSDWSLNSLYLKVMDVGSSMITRCMKLLHEEKVTTWKNDISKGSYYAFPTREDVKVFRSLNKRFFKYY